MKSGPYVGYLPFGRDDADRFFGRARESWELTQRILNHRLVVVHGRPGVGKTSLLAAGVGPALVRELAHILPDAAPAIGSATLPERESAANPLVLGLLTAWAGDRGTEARRDQTISRFLQDLEAELLDRPDPPQALVAIVDPCDGLLRDHAPVDDATREGFLDQLAEAVEVVDRFHLVLAMGSDVVEKLARHEDQRFGRDLYRYEVKALGRDAALDAVTGPLEATGRSFAPAVAEQLVDRLRTTVITNEVGGTRTVVGSTVEPTSLQVVCSALWRDLPEAVDVITTEDLRTYGDVDAALTEHCARAAIEVSAQESAPIQDVWRWLETTFVTDLGTRAMAYEGLIETGRMPHGVARGFEQHRVLCSEERAGAVWFQLLADSLIEPVRHGRRLFDQLAALAEPQASPDTFLQIAESALRSGMLPVAEEYARGAVLANEANLKALAEAKSFLGNLVFTQGLAESGSRAEQLYAAAEDNLRHAAQLYETERDTPGVGRALAALGRLLMKRGRITDALGELRGALERLGGDVGVRLDFARALRDAGQTQAALAEYTAVLTFAPDSVEALVGRGALAAQHGDPAAALRDLDTAIRLDPTSAGRRDVVAARTRAAARRESLRSR